MSMNRLANAKNPFQGSFPKTLCVCSAGLLRSPTLAWVLSNSPWNHNTRACGLHKDFALIPLDKVLIEWADNIIFVEPDLFSLAQKEFFFNGKKVVLMNIPDDFPTRDPDLVSIICEQLHELGV